MIEQLDAQTRPPNRVIVIGQGYTPKVPRTANTTVELLPFRKNMGCGFRWRIVEEMDPGSIAVSLDDDMSLGLRYIEQSLLYASTPGVDAISWGGVDRRFNWYFAWHRGYGFIPIRYLMAGLCTVPSDYIVGISESRLSHLLDGGGNDEALVSSWLRKHGHDRIFRPPGSADMKFTAQAYDPRSGSRMMFDYMRQFFGIELVTRML